MHSSTHLMILAGMLTTLASTAAQNGRIAGTVTDANDQPVLGAVVIVCDRTTGIPVSQSSYLPFTKEMQFQDIAFVTTDAQGTFSVRNVKPGTYRLLAQSWIDSEESVKQVMDVNGRIVQLHGIASDIDVPSNAAERISIRPLGTATLDVTTAPQAPNDETLIAVSSEPLSADPVLGFAAWSGPFMPNMLVANRMPHGKTIFRGLPTGTCHVAAFAADNNPGFGGVSCEAQADRTSVVTLPLIASWSEGHKQPPKNLEPLVKKLQAADGQSLMELLRRHDPEVAKKVEEARSQTRNPWSALIPLLGLTVEMDDGQRTPLKDLLAADGYARLLRHAEDRRNRLQQNQPKQTPVASVVTYEHALRDLHARLGRDYPCFQLKGIDWQAVGTRLLPKVKDIQSDDEFGLICLEMVAALEDSHAQLLPAAAQIPAVPFPSWDAGFACLVDDRGQPVVYYVAADSSAADAGLQIGMTVKEVNGVDAQLAIARTMKQLKQYVGYSSQRYLRYHAFRFFARQAERGQDIEILASDPQGNEATLAMKAVHAAGYLPRLPVAREGIRDSGDVSWKILDKEIGYIYVRRISSNLIDSLDKAVRELNAARGLVIDVRGNSGGGFDANRSFRNFDLDDGAEPSRPRFTKRIAVLVDARCISAGEGWTSWFVARQRAKLFGEATAGASARKTNYQLRNGLFTVRYPVKAYRGSLDRPIERRGLEPDVRVMPNALDLADGQDTVLAAAESWLRESDE